MGEKATFHIADDWVALLELKPAARTVYGVLRCNAAFGRAGVATHTVHVTSSWFTKMTEHWESPLTPPTVRRGLNELIKKGVLLRLNDPQDGSGFLLAFVTDPGPNYDGPVNGFEHAKKVAKKYGTKAYYVRRDEVPGTPSVTGIRRELGRKGNRREPAPPERWDLDEAGTEVDPEPDFDILDEVENENRNEPERKTLPPQMEALAEALERRTARLNVPGHRLTRDQCRMVAQECGQVLALGWDPATLAHRMVSQMGPKIHSPLKFLPKKAVELGAPPAPPSFPVAPRQPEPAPAPAPVPAPTPEDAAKGAGGPAMQKFQEFWAHQQRLKKAGQSG